MYEVHRCTTEVYALHKTVEGAGIIKEGRSHDSRPKWTARSYRIRQKTLHMSCNILLRYGQQPFYRYS